MGMELLTATDTDKLHVGASGILSNAQAQEDQFKRLDGLILSLFPGWEGEASDSLYFLWRDFYNAMHETWGTIRHAGYGMSRLANELELAQFEYRKWVAAAEAAGFTIGADGMISELPPVAPDPDIRTLAQRADDYRMYAHRIEGALEEAEAADRRAAEIFDRELRDHAQFRNEALAIFLKTALATEGYVSALTGTPGRTADILDDLARNGAQSAAGAAPYRRLANNRILTLLTRTSKGLPITTWVTAPLSYVQSRAEGNDSGEALTDAIVGTAMGVATGAAGAGIVYGVAAGAGAMGFIVPQVWIPIGLGIAALGATWATVKYTPTVSRFVHDRLVTPLSEDIQELGDNLRDDFSEAMEALRIGAKNFPSDFREAIIG